MELNILFEDDDIIVCEKPVGVLSQSGKTNEDDMISILKRYLYETKDIVNAYIGLVHRLDRGVGGVMVFAKSKNALIDLNKQIQNKQLKKNYLAVCENVDNSVIEKGDKWINVVNFIAKDAKNNMSYITQTKEKTSKRSELNYKVLDVSEDNLLVYIEVELITGRHHQIRVQMNGQNMPLWGDTKYNESFVKNHPEIKWSNIALYSYKLEFIHPIKKEKMTFLSDPVNEPFNLFV